MRPQGMGTALAVLGLIFLVACDAGTGAPASPTAILPTATSQPTATAVAPSPIPATATAVPATSTAVPATTPPTLTVAPAANTGAYLVYAMPDGGLWRVDRAGQPAQLVAAPEPHAPLPWAAAPDGTTIAYVSGTAVWNNSPQYAAPGARPALALWMVQADGSSARKIQDLLPQRPVDLTPGGDDMDLLQALTSYQDLAWSPDGRQIAFVSAQDNQVDVYAATVDGQVTRLTDSADLKKSPRWSPDSALVAAMTTTGFGTGAGWGDTGLIVAPRTGGRPVQVLRKLTLANGKPAAFFADLLWTGPDTVVAELEAVPTEGVDVLALDTATGKTSVILAMDEAVEPGMWWNRAQRVLAIAGAPGFSATPTPNGKQGLHVWHADTQQTEQLTSGKVGPAIMGRAETLAPVGPVAWSPAGLRLAYNVTAPDAEAGLYLWDAQQAPDGTRLQAQPVYAVVWSPDGQQLAAGPAIYNLDGKPQATLPGAEPNPLGWGPDGLFFATRDSRYEGSASTRLWLWDGTQAHLLAAGLEDTDGAGMVLGHK
jgi:dipeptidyl aminopeptidase/acylaminoacyl peptidase